MNLFFQMQSFFQCKDFRVFRLFLAIAILVFCCFPIISHALIMHTSDGAVMSLQGEIETGDTIRLQRLLAKYPTPYAVTDHRVVEIIVVIKSNGGNVSEALTLGRYLRSRNAAIVVEDHCASSCIFFLAAGVVRAGNGKLIIHRPYGTEISKNPKTGALRRIQEELTNYIDAMNVPLALIERIFSIAPENAHELTEQETEQFRLRQMDLDFAEELSIYNARRSALSRNEYMKRLRTHRENMDKCSGSAIKLTYCFNASRERLGLKGDYDWL